MPAARLSFFQFYPADWLLSRTRFRLTPSGRAAYFDIICLCYQSEDGCIEWDTDYLTQLTGATPSDLAACQNAMTEHVKGRWTHNRVQVEITRMRRESERAREKANRRWNKEKASSGNAQHGTGNASRAEHSKAEHSKDTPLSPSEKGGVSPTENRPAGNQRTARAGSGPARSDGAHPTGAPKGTPAQKQPVKVRPDGIPIAGKPEMDPRDPAVCPDAGMYWDVSCARWYYTPGGADGPGPGGTP